MRHPVPFGKYLLLERISVGGMAEVFKAKAFGVEGFEKIIAIKRILPSMAEDADFIQMFIDEAKICAQLNHANICQTFELGRIGDSHFIAMEYIWGKDLLQMQNRFRRTRKAMPPTMAAFIASKVCEGLDYAHRKKDATGRHLTIIHRDVSPQNILISYEGEIRVIDFGIAKAASRSSKTQAGVLKGKFGYMSPEHVRGMNLDRRADIFAIGTILYEILTNERLFLGESDFATLEKVRNVDVPPPSKVNPAIPEALDQIIMKALAREVEDRYQWASEMQEALQNFLANEEQVYNTKMLAGWMRDQFRTEMQREAGVLEEQRRIGPEALGAGGPPRSLAPPSARLRQPTLAGGVPQVHAPDAVSLPPIQVQVPTESLADSQMEQELSSSAIEVDEELGEDGLQSEKTAISTGNLTNEKTSISTGHDLSGGGGDAEGGDLPTESTRILDGPADGSGELQATPTVVFNPATQPAPPAPQNRDPAPAQSPAVPAVIVQQQQPMYQQNPAAMSAMGMQVPMQMQMQGGMPGMPSNASYSAMPAGSMPYGTGAFVAVTMPGGGTGMVMLPQGAYIPGMTGAYQLPMQQQQQQQQQQRTGFLWKDILVGILAAVTVVAVVLGVKLALAPGRGSIILTVLPPRAAEVLLDNKAVGRVQPGGSLLLREVTRGSHRLRVRADDGEAQQVVNVTAGEPVQLTVQLYPLSQAPQGSGVIKLKVPVSSLVSIDNRLVSEKDAQKGYLVAAGVAHEIIVRKPGMREQRLSVTVAAGAEEDRTIELQPGRGKLIITTDPAEAEVSLDGALRGKSPVTIDSLDPNREIKVSVRRRGYSSVVRHVVFDEQRGYEQTMDIKLTRGRGETSDRSEDSGSGSAPQTPSATPEPAAASGEPGYLIANTKPWAKVYIDGVDTGKTTPIAPRDRIPLKPGKHTVTFFANGKKYAFEVTVKAGQEIKVLRELSDGN